MTTRKEETKEEATNSTATIDTYTHISIVLDRSGSMRTIHADTMGGFNQFLSDQKALGGKATLTMIQFDDQYEILKDMQPIETVDELTGDTYQPRGNTALLDAIGRTINRVEHQISELEVKPDKSIFVIITDGQENASREFNRTQIFEMIRRLESENHWQFIFIGANQDAITEASNMGIRAGNSLTYGANSGGVGAMYASMSRSMSSYRTANIDCAATMDYFSADDRTAQASQGGVVDSSIKTSKPDVSKPKEPKEPEELAFNYTRKS